MIRNVSDPINEDTLREVAAELGDEWKLLAQCLNVTRMRIEAILRNCNQNEDEESGLEEARFEMLLTWVKRVPRSVSKVNSAFQLKCVKGHSVVQLKHVKSRSAF